MSGPCQTGVKPSEDGLSTLVPKCGPTAFWSAEAQGMT